ncbi:O-antigen/teichoic acid export membrane protein [Kitasatospora sp. MAP12-15]|uniref:lipopolysaccharide biosynthesis protein n=1 Tax=unclassified Kitasatospora TaxID=2633591 RepID=UPI0024760111|nr:hypothetical protein [Kitasatospora sp. MAP12-44]MDH6111015.1 O-antigen/teichoic acid export membrane protein [Kitasatospora sp. MAP12-44]
MNPVAKLLKALPPGTQAVGAGTVVLGAASYIHIAVANANLAATPRADVSVLWTIVFSAGIGLFFPVEQELTRIVAARAVDGEGAAPVLRRAALLTTGILAATLALLAVFARPIADTLFDRDVKLVAALGAAFIGMALCYVTRGILAGLGLFKIYGIQLGVDGCLRIGLAFGCAAAGLHSALAFSLILAVAPLTALLVTLPFVLRAALPGPQISWGDLSRGLGILVCSTVLAQVVVNAAVMSTKLLNPQALDLVTALLSALVLARVPLFVFGSLQASLLSGLASSAAAGDQQGFVKMLRRTCVVVTGLGLSGGVPAVVLGPWLIHTLLRAPDVLTSWNFVWFSLGTLSYMLAMVLGQALMVLRRHGLQLICWVVGTAVLAAITLVPGDLATRVSIAYAGGSFMVAAAMVLALLRPVKAFSAATENAQVPPSTLESAAR